MPKLTFRGLISKTDMLQAKQDELPINLAVSEGIHRIAEDIITNREYDITLEDSDIPEGGTNITVKLVVVKPSVAREIYTILMTLFRYYPHKETEKEFFKKILSLMYGEFGIDAWFKLSNVQPNIPDPVLVVTYDSNTESVGQYYVAADGTKLESITDPERTYWMPIPDFHPPVIKS
jgi:hypothetical protein